MKRWLLLCVASPEVGFGHLSRMLLVAHEARAQGIQATVVRSETPDAPHPAGDIDAPLITPFTPEGLRPLLANGPRPDVLLIDAPHAILNQLAWLESYDFGERRPLVATFRMSDVDAEETFEDLVLIPSIEPSRTEVTLLRGRHVRTESGQHLVLIRERLFAREGDKDGDVPHIVVTMGGSDPAGLTRLACDACAPVLARRAKVTVALGTMNPARSALQRDFAGVLDMVDQSDVDFDRLLRAATVAVIAGGLTRYECIAAKTPFVAVSPTPVHADYSERVVRAGFGMHLGTVGDVTPDATERAIASLLDDATTRERMIDTATGLVDEDATASLCRHLDRLSTSKTAVA